MKITQIDIYNELDRKILRAVLEAVDGHTPKGFQSSSPSNESADEPQVVTVYTSQGNEQRAKEQLSEAVLPIGDVHSEPKTPAERRKAEKIAQATAAAPTTPEPTPDPTPEPTPEPAANMTPERKRVRELVLSYPKEGKGVDVALSIIKKIADVDSPKDIDPKLYPAVITALEEGLKSD